MEPPVTDLLVVRHNSYHDSARLMAISRRLQALPGIREAEVMMGTPLNLELLRSAGWSPTSATPLDLVVALRGEQENDLHAAEAALTGLLAGGETATSRHEQRPGTVAEAVALHPGTNLVSIAVPGPYAAFVAHRALDAGKGTIHNPRRFTDFRIAFDPSCHGACYLAYQYFM